MNKKFFSLVFLVLVCFFLSGCRREESIILLNHYPITRANVLDNATQFKTDEKIHYIYMTKKNLTCEFVRVKVFKRNSTKTVKGSVIGNAIYSNDFRLKKGEINYFTDYIVLHSPGEYIMMIYKTDNLWRPDAIAEFQLIDR